MTRPFGPSFQLQGATKTPLCGAKGRLLRLRTTRRARERRNPPWSLRRTQSAPEAPRLPRHTTSNADGGGKVPGSRGRGRGRGRDDSECLLATPTTPALVRDTRRVSELRTGVRCARQVCGGARVPAARRVERASQRRLSDVAAQWQRRSTRALTMFSAGNRRRRARGGEQGPAEVVYLCSLPIWGQPLARQRPCCPSVAPG